MIKPPENSGKTRRTPGALAWMTRALGVLLLVWLCHSAASGFWLLFPPPALQGVAMQEAANRAVLDVNPGHSRPVADPELLIRLPFASSGVGEFAQRDVSQAAVDTALALVLKGAVPSSDRLASRAIIAEGDRQNVVHEGELLPISVAGVSLAQVHTDRVVLDNNGRAETLWMHQPASKADGRNGHAGDVMPQDLQSAVPASLEAVASFSLHRTEDGRAGLKLRSRGDGRLFRRLGFRNDDVVLSINGKALQDDPSPLAFAESLRGTGTASVQVLRNQQPLDLAVDLSILD